MTDGSGAAAEAAQDPIDRGDSPQCDAANWSSFGEALALVMA
jgi:hypothetical protein